LHVARQQPSRVRRIAAICWPWKELVKQQAATVPKGLVKSAKLKDVRGPVMISATIVKGQRTSPTQYLRVEGEIFRRSQNNSFANASVFFKDEWQCL
jgi:hypothetical protein